MIKCLIFVRQDYDSFELLNVSVSQDLSDEDYLKIQKLVKKISSDIELAGWGLNTKGDDMQIYELFPLIEVEKHSGEYYGNEWENTNNALKSVCFTGNISLAMSKDEYIDHMLDLEKEEEKRNRYIKKLHELI